MAFRVQSYRTCSALLAGSVHFENVLFPAMARD
jgi:hypothetical protein